MRSSFSVPPWRFRVASRIRIEGVEPLCPQTFSALGVSAEVEQALAARGIARAVPYPVARRPGRARGRDVLGKSPTGSGKTLAFALPIVERVTAGDGPGRARARADPRARAPGDRGARDARRARRASASAAAYGGAPVHAQVKRCDGAHIVVATPGRLQDLDRARLISLEHVRILILDEADRMLDMGFQPQVERIIRRLPARRQTMLFSATLDGDVGELASAYTTQSGRFEAELPSRQADGDVEHEFVSVTERRQARPPDRAARARARARAGLRAHEARRRPPRPEAARARRRGGRDARRHDPAARASGRSSGSAAGKVDDAGRHRRRRPRPRPRRHHAT